MVQEDAAAGSEVPTERCNEVGDAVEGVDHAERKFDPESGSMCTYSEYLEAHKNEFSEEDIQTAWAAIDGQERRFDVTTGMMYTLTEYHDALKETLSEDQINVAWDGLLLERRLNTADSAWYTWEEFHHMYAEQCSSEDEVFSYWEQMLTFEQFSELQHGELGGHCEISDAQEQAAGEAEHVESEPVAKKSKTSGDTTTIAGQ
eukprot:TRINITY_DN683_c0_g1_i4.p1 TRINITY_DN683_c0_g1~~TRINITY_DN683_c0_g1_i4.p1  ORF type:complete len:203 (+),score=42.43 TRINITY_DN683_c0_g1_i4:87-695(+)